MAMRNLNINYMYVNLPNGNVDKIIRSIRNHKYENNSLLIFIIPTPKQEIINYIISKIQI